ncbi:type IV pilus assembly protein PilM [Patescibacteria group bacterium]|nr:type IV pilus assembly protein PilM [Patescibacteria group bacterium]HPD07976.1 type IV pilus assembly protein PilM [bacterium]HRT11325.1 type IV pilus assembly protein PilM [Patescibacteria group bacterium]HRU90091.1 type IV pilus assembly protein PilM [Patescibacteria group bacterium]
MALFKSEANDSCLGVDIGTSGIKIVELKRDDKRVVLSTYGFSESLGGNNPLNMPIEDAAKTITKIWQDAGMTSRRVVASLPNFSVFSSIITLVDVSDANLSMAVNAEAKKVMPLPLEEMVLDWKKIPVPIGQQVGPTNSNAADIKSGAKSITRILLTGAPKVLVNKYIEIFKAAELNLVFLEGEIIALIRSLVGNDKGIIMIVEVGSTNTDLVIIDHGVPVFNRSLDLGGLTVTETISKNLNIDLQQAEQFKYDLGVAGIRSAELPEALKSLVDSVASEIKYSLNLFQSNNGKSVEKIIMTGGSSLLYNFPEYLSKALNMNVIIGSPWTLISYPLNIKPLLDEIGPRLAVAVGLAMRGIS